MFHANKKEIMKRRRLHKLQQASAACKLLVVSDREKGCVPVLQLCVGMSDTACPGCPERESQSGGSYMQDACNGTLCMDG